MYGKIKIYPKHLTIPYLTLESSWTRLLRLKELFLHYLPNELRLNSNYDSDLIKSPLRQVSIKHKTKKAYLCIL